MSTKQAAHQILTIWHDLRSKKIDAENARERMAALKSMLGETAYEQAKLVAVVNDR